MIHTIEDYIVFRNQVLRFTDGKNIHEVNGVLGRIMNTIGLRNNALARGDAAKAEQHETNINDWTKEIRMLVPKTNI